MNWHEGPELQISTLYFVSSHAEIQWNVGFGKVMYYCLKCIIYDFFKLFFFGGEENIYDIFRIY